MTRKPWHGVLVATALPWRDDDTPDLESYARHVAWLAANGCHGVTPNGSLGEYQVLSDAQRDAVVRTAVEAAPEGFDVMPGIGAYGARQARRNAEVAAEAGCRAVMLLPPNSYRANVDEVIEHYRIVAEVGVPVVAYNNPFDTKVDLVPELLARLFGEGYIVAVKEFTGDVRRYWELAELVPDLEVLAGSDDVAMELALAGSPGWVSGYPNAFPRACVELWERAQAGDLQRALPLYRTLHPLLRWDSKTEFVQAIKLSMDLVADAVDGGRCQPPRGPLSQQQAAVVREATEKALAAGLA
ncbi:dihydrodipicolinate synthase family protein [Nakamurella endophytica]|uniref:Dihydrodipicolinate synthase family protein n=1 Tax=Nakamurella endophytica TaxID=1748367 RepID=A0A917WME3_9ACTN|nr:dihydrodipicolinate synthase family protein [Nakamurella endophytica]GGM16304.1 dihydrodipicolinate synthase family protein [Nakamurella endophytica]